MKFAILASTAILLSTGFAFAADTDASTAGRPTGVLSQAECVATWHAAAGEPLTRFHRAHDRLVPVNARGIITNFQQADTNEDGKVSQDEFFEACKLGLVTGSAVDFKLVEDDLY